MQLSHSGMTKLLRVAVATSVALCKTSALGMEAEPTVINKGGLAYRIDIPLPPARGHYQPRATFVLKAGYQTNTASYGRFVPAPKIVQTDTGYAYRDLDNEDTDLALQSRDGPGHYALRQEPGYLDLVPTMNSSGNAVAWDAWDSKGTHYRFEGVTPEFHLHKVIDANGNRTEYVYGRTAANGGMEMLTSIHYNFYDPANPNSTAAVPATATAYAASIDLEYDDYDKVAAVRVKIDAGSGLTTIRGYEAGYLGTWEWSAVLQSFTEVLQGATRRLQTTLDHGVTGCPSCPAAIVTPRGARFVIAYDAGYRVKSLTLSGPGLQANTKTYWYPLQNQTVSQDSVTRIVTKTWWEPMVVDAAARIDTGVETAAGTDTTPPQYFLFQQKTVERTWRDISSTTCVPPVANSEGVVLAVDPGLSARFWFSSRVREVAYIDGTALARERTIGCSSVDAYGNVSARVVDPDGGRAGDEYVLRETFVPPSAQHTCVDCVSSRTRCATYADGSCSPQETYYYDSAAHPSELWIPGARNPATGSSPPLLAARWTYNENGTLATIVQGTLTRSLTYDAPFQVRVAKDTSSEGTKSLVTDVAYDSLGNVSLVTGPYLASGSPGPQRGFKYDDLGRVTVVARGPITTSLNVDAIAAFQYADSGTSPSRVTTYSFAVPKTFSDGSIPVTPDVVQRSVFFDALGRAIQARARLGGTGDAEAGAHVVDNLSASAFRVSDVVLYDGAGRPTATLEPFYSATGDFVDYRAAVVDGMYSGSSAATHATLFTYDAKGRVTCRTYRPVASNSMIPAAGTCRSDFTESAAYARATGFTYRAWNGLLGVKIIPPENNLTMTAEGRAPTGPESFFDPSGRMTGTVDVDQNTTEYSYLGNGLLGFMTRRVAAPVNGRPSSVVTSFSYDDALRLSERADPNAGTRTFWYDAQSRVARVQLPARDLGSGVKGRDEVQFDYDMGRPSATRTCAATSATTVSCATDWVLTYDTPYDSSFQYVAGRLAWAQKSGLATIRYGYSPEGVLARRAYELSGLSGTFDISDTVLPDGRTASTAVSSPAGSFRYDNSFDSFARLAQISSSGSSGTTYWRAPVPTALNLSGAYDSLGRLGSVDLDKIGSGNRSAQVIWSFKPYSGLEDAVRATLGVSDVHWASTETYRGLQLTSYRDEVGKTTYSYWYTDSGQLRGAKAVPFASAPLAQASSMCASYTLSQDFRAGSSFGNLERVRETVAPAFTDTYGYAGQGLETIVPPGPDAPTTLTTMLTTNSSTNPLLYDQAGRVSSKGLGTESFGYDLFSRLTRVTRSGTLAEALAYDPTGALLGRASGSNVTYYLGGRATVTATALPGCEATGCAVDPSTMKVDVHLVAGATRVASARIQNGATGRVLYYYRDHQGGVVATSLGGGTAGMSYRYGPWGELRNTQGATETDDNASERGFANGIRLTGTLLVMGVRIYDTQLRQFLQPDPVDPMTYTYVGGDPVNRVDPTGMISEALDPPVPVSEIERSLFVGEGWVGAGAGDYYGIMSRTQVAYMNQNLLARLAETRGSQIRVESVTRYSIWTSSYSYDGLVPCGATGGICAGETLTGRRTVIEVHTIGMGFGLAGLLGDLAEPAVGHLRIGTNGHVYSTRFYGNQYVSTARASSALKVVSAFTFFAGVGIDYLEMNEGRMSPAHFGVNTGVGAYGLLLGLPGVPLTGTYYLIDNFYPGGMPGALDAAGNLAATNQGILGPTFRLFGQGGLD